jgi:hypothetical protein
MKIEKGIAKNMELVGYHDVDDKPGIQMAMQVVNHRWYLYIAHWYHQGWSIMDVTEPSGPKYIKFIPDPGGKPATFTIKVQVANGIMITQMQQRIPIFFGNPPDAPFDEGIYIWDVKDPENPKRLGHWKTGSAGTHRNYYDGGRYVHLSAACPGFSGNIYRIVDIDDPTHPVEVGRWWLPEQWSAGGVPAAGPAAGPLGRFFLHGPPYPKGDKAYLSYHGLGMVILDISDITLPRFVGKLQTAPPLGGQSPTCHTVLPITKRKLALMTSEGRRIPVIGQGTLQGGPLIPLNFIGMVDVSDETNPTLIAIFPIPEPPPGSPYKNFSETKKVGAYGFGPHNLHEPHNHPDLEDRDDRIYATYFSAGVRVYDISDPFLPREIAYYLPPDPKKWTWQRPGGFGGELRATTEDILVDKRGYIYVTDMQQGLHILRCTV